MLLHFTHLQINWVSQHSDCITEQIWKAPGQRFYDNWVSPTLTISTKSILLSLGFSPLYKQYALLWCYCGVVSDSLWPHLGFSQQRYSDIGKKNKTYLWWIILKIALFLNKLIDLSICLRSWNTNNLLVMNLAVFRTSWYHYEIYFSIPKDSEFILCGYTLYFEIHRPPKSMDRFHQVHKLGQKKKVYICICTNFWLKFGIPSIHLKYSEKDSAGFIRLGTGSMTQKRLRTLKSYSSSWWPHKLSYASLWNRHNVSIPEPGPELFPAW